MAFRRRYSRPYRIRVNGPPTCRHGINAMKDLRKITELSSSAREINT
jgi:hypothetical protein